MRWAGDCTPAHPSFVTFLVQALTIYSAQVIAKEKEGAIGIAPFTDRVDFGDVPAGLSVSKEITLTNEGSNPNNIKVFTMGSIGAFIDIEPKSFTVEAGESRTVKLKLTMPGSAEPEQKFTGRILILRLPILW